MALPGVTELLPVVDTAQALFHDKAETEGTVESIASDTSSRKVGAAREGQPRTPARERWALEV